jgi:hypothetical protein
VNPLAAFQVITIGRFWVIPEGSDRISVGPLRPSDYTLATCVLGLRGLKAQFGGPQAKGWDPSAVASCEGPFLTDLRGVRKGSLIERVPCAESVPHCCHDRFLATRSGSSRKHQRYQNEHWI